MSLVIIILSVFLFLFIITLIVSSLAMKKAVPQKMTDKEF